MSRLGGRRAAASDMKEVLKDGRMWTLVGIVVARDGDGSHFEIENDDNGNPVDVLVELDLMPRKEPCTARLTACAGGPGSGLWKVPPAGSEVMVCIPDGHMENGAVIVGVLSSRNVVGALDADKMVLINPKDVIIASKTGKVYLGSEDGSGTKPVAFKDAQVDLGTFAFASVAATGPGVGGGTATLIWTPPGGGSPVTLTNSSADLTGKVKEGSATTEVKP